MKSNFYFIYPNTHYLNQKTTKYFISLKKLNYDPNNLNHRLFTTNNNYIKFQNTEQTKNNVNTIENNTQNETPILNESQPIKKKSTLTNRLFKSKQSISNKSNQQLNRFSAIGDDQASLSERTTPISPDFKPFIQELESEITIFQLMAKNPVQCLSYWFTLYLLTGIFLYIFIESIGIDEILNHLTLLGIISRERANILQEQYESGHKLRVLILFNEYMEIWRFGFVVLSFRFVLNRMISTSILKNFIK